MRSEVFDAHRSPGGPLKACGKGLTDASVLMAIKLKEGPGKALSLGKYTAKMLALNVFCHLIRGQYAK